MVSTSETDAMAKPGAMSETVAGNQAARSAEKIRALLTMLEKEQRLIGDEIAAYPSPIAGCDVQFNSLLERRRLITRALSQLAALASEVEEISDLDDRLREIARAPQVVASSTASG